MDMNVFLRLLTFLLPGVLCQRCPAYWLEMVDGDSCYKLWPTGMKTWNDARDTCRHQNGDLLRLDTENEKDWIIQEIMKHPPEYEWWIGLKRHSANDTSWEWIDGTQRNESDPYIQWGSGEPNNYRDEEDCAEIWDNLLNDKNCEQPLQFICERPKDLPLPCDVDNGWDNLIRNSTESCYKLFDKQQSFQEALDICKSNEAVLLVITDEFQQYAITVFLLSFNMSSWLDITSNKTSKYWYTKKGTLSDNSLLPIEPSNNSSLATNKTCSLLDTSESDYKNWKLVDCNTPHEFVCVKQQDRCPMGFVQHLANCYLIYTQELFTWNEARGFCNLRSTKLLEIDLKNQDTLPFVVRLLDNMADISDVSSIWLQISENIAKAKVNYKNVNMLISSSSNESGCEYIEKGMKGWSLTDCGETKGTICTVPVNTPVVRPTSLKPRYECPDGYELSGINCYRVYPGETLDWLSARRKCAEDGSDLATILSTTNQIFLKGLIQSEVWIGLNDRSKDGEYTWLDSDEKPGTSFWMSTEPNNIVIDDMYSEDCVAMSYFPGIMEHGQWIDYPCSFKRNFICAMKAEWNIALGKLPSQSKKQFYDVHKPIDGCIKRTFDSKCCSHIQNEFNPWWELDLGTEYQIGKIIIHRRYEESCTECFISMAYFRVFASNSSGNMDFKNLVYQDQSARPPAKFIINLANNVTTARYIRIDIPNRRGDLSLCEVQVYPANRVRSTILMPGSSICFTDSKKYNGTISHTVSGRKCQAWVTDHPHKHGYHTDRFVDGTESDAKAYCRDPRGEGAPWCYTTDPYVRWEFCAIPHCDSAPEGGFIKPQSPISQSDSCETEWLDDESGTCLWYGNRKLTWADVVDSCNYIGATPVDQFATSLDTAFAGLSKRFGATTFAIWLGVYFEKRSGKWALISGENISMQIPPNANKICLQALQKDKSTDVTFQPTHCSDRAYYICMKPGKYIKYHTTKNGRRQEIAKSIPKNSSIILELKSADGGIIILNDIKQKTNNIEYNITIGGTINLKSSIRVTPSKYVSNSVSWITNLTSGTDYRTFWINWNNRIIQIGRGNQVGRNIFMNLNDSNFENVDSILIASQSGSDAFWRFQRSTLTATMDHRKLATNIAMLKPTTQTDTYSTTSGPERAVDGCLNSVFNSGCCTHTLKIREPWWQVDLGNAYDISKIVITRRSDCCAERLNTSRVFLSMYSDSTMQDDIVYQSRGTPPPKLVIPTPNKHGRYVKVDIPDKESILELCEVEVYEDLSASTCGHGWTDFHDQGICYMFPSVLLNWNDSQDYCLNLASNLAVPRSSSEQLYIYEHGLPRVTPNAVDDIWLGFHNLDHAIKAVDGSSVSYLNIANASTSGLDCVAMSIDNSPTSGRLTYRACDVQKKFACQKAEQSTPSTTVATTITTLQSTTLQSVNQTMKQGDCKFGWYYNGLTKACYGIQFFSGKDFFMASAECMKLNADLLTIQNKAEQNFIRGLLKTVLNNGGLGSKPSEWSSFWIGGIDAVVEGHWRWYMSDSPWPNDIEWAANQPDNFNNEDCATIYTNGYLNDLPCDDRQDILKGAICKYKIDNARCDKNWSYFDETGFCYALKDDRYVTWDEATEMCLKHNASLVSIHSRAEQDFVQALSFNRKLLTDSFWVGASDADDEGLWRWNDGSLWWGNVIWTPGNPDNWKSFEHCATMRIGNDRGTLNDIKCDHKCPYMCKKLATTLLPSDTSTSRQSDQTTAMSAATILSSAGTTTGNTRNTSADFSTVTCGPDWELNSQLQTCYKIITNTQQPWGIAKNNCLAEGGSLLSVVTATEQFYINGRLQGVQSLLNVMWIGLHDLDLQSGWKWIDGQPFSYLNWHPGEPDIFHQKCVAMVTTIQNFGMWRALSCSITGGYICKKPAAVSITSPMTPSVNTDKNFACPGNGWLDYKSSCFLIVEKVQNWNEAQKYCHQEGAELASIDDEIEQQFIFSQLPSDKHCFNIWSNTSQCLVWAERGECERNPVWMSINCHDACKICIHDCRDRYSSSVKCSEWASLGECNKNSKWMLANCAMSCGVCQGAPTRGYWIGLHSSNYEQSYYWSDRNRVKFTNWDVEQPRYIHSVRESCAAIFLQNGKWNDGDCDNELPGSICKQPKHILPSTSLSPFQIGCSMPKSYGYRQFCYIYVDKAKTWTEAQKYCNDSGGTLVRLTDKYAQAFVASELGNRRQDYWMDLIVDENQLQWSDAKPLILSGHNASYHHFAESFVLAGSKEASISGCFALATTKPVGLWKLYNCSEELPFLCQSSREGFTDAAVLSTTSSAILQECAESWTEFNGYCYYLSTKQTLSWIGAKEDCLHRGGFLTSILSEKENMFIKSLTKDEKLRVWIGLHDQETKGTFRWDDGTDLVYTRWQPGEPNEWANVEDCAETRNGEWNDMTCAVRRHYICKIPQGKPVNEDLPPLPRKVCADNDNWLAFGEYCYFLEERPQGWHDASGVCTAQKGYLTTVHSRDEMDFLIDLASSTKTNVWIGLIALTSRGIFKWTDNSPVDFTFWNPGEPSNEIQSCAVILENGLWDNRPCYIRNPFICKKSISTLPITTPSVTNISEGGGCLPEFLSLGNKCYFGGGLNADKKSWSEAKDICQQMNSSLVSIHSSLEQAFITLMLSQTKTGVWTGLHNLDNKGLFRWDDGSLIDFTNWGIGEPSSIAGSFYLKEPCVEIQVAGENIGQWNDIQCYGLRGYICQHDKQSNLPEPSQNQTLGNCFRNNCYKITLIAQTWEESQNTCVADGFHLATISDVFEEAFMILLSGSIRPDLWIGGKKTDYGLYWVSQEEVGYDKTDTDYGTYVDGMECISLTENIWSSNYCSDKKHAVCEKPLETSGKQNTCKDGICYSFVSFLHEKFEQYEAQIECLIMNMSLASIHSKMENEAVRTSLGHELLSHGKDPANTDVWIGLTTSGWVDASHTAYQNFDHEYSEDDAGECTVLSAVNGRWLRRNCNNKYGFVCKAQHGSDLAPPDDVSTEYPSETMSKSSFPNYPFNKPQGKSEIIGHEKLEMSAGQIAGVVIAVFGVLFVIGVAIYFIRSIKFKKQLFQSNMQSLGFDNALFQRNQETLTIG